MIYPVQGREPRLPRSRARLPKSGRRVVLDSYWRRRLADGDVTLEDPRTVSKQRKRESAAPEEG